MVKTDSGVVASIFWTAGLHFKLLHCWLRVWCGNLRNDSGHVVCRLGVNIKRIGAHRHISTFFYADQKLDFNL